MSRVIKVRQITATTLSPGGILAGRIEVRRSKSINGRPFVRYVGEFTFWPRQGDTVTSPWLVLPHGLESGEAPIPQAWERGDFAGIVKPAPGMEWEGPCISSPLAVDLAKAIAQTLLTADQLQRDVEDD